MEKGSQLAVQMSDIIQRNVMWPELHLVRCYFYRGRKLFQSYKYDFFQPDGRSRVAKCQFFHRSFMSNLIYPKKKCVNRDKFLTFKVLNGHKGSSHEKKTVKKRGHCPLLTNPPPPPLTGEKGTFVV